MGLTELPEMEITQMRSRSEMTRAINSAVLRVSCLKKKSPFICHIFESSCKQAC